MPERSKLVSCSWFIGSTLVPLQTYNMHQQQGSSHKQTVSLI
ncbi:hypothetical protein LINPERHAP2_LOCUS3741 [Linum perenne]